MADFTNYSMEHHHHDPESRIDYYEVASEAFGHIKALEIYSRTTDLEHSFRELIKLRVSQINGCPYCIEVHSKAAKQLEATDEQIENVESWERTDVFDDRQKMAFELAEHVTLISEKGVSDELYERARKFYDEREYVDLILVINQANLWNRITISMGVTL